MALGETAQLAVRIDLEGNAAAGIANLQRNVKGLGGSFAKVGKGVGQVGAGFAKAGLLLGGAAITGLTGAVKLAIDFEDAFAGVVKTVNEADLTAVGLSFEDLAKDFRTMATEIPISAVEFARLGETAGALGIAAEDIVEFTRITALLGVTTDLTADQAADSLGRIGTILKFTGQDYENFADTLVALGNDGASVESEIIEITKRFAAEAKAAGLATSEIAALGSATASLGFAPERGGTALARVFGNLATNISLANEQGQAFSDITGRSIEDLQKSINKGDTLGIFLDVLEGLKGLTPTQANRALEAMGITNVSDRTIFRTMSDNLPFINEQLDIAEKSTGALAEEATKRFNTLSSKLIVLKQNLFEAGMVIGEGMTPAIGRATTKLTEFLKDADNLAALKQLGVDIGDAIDDIDWDAVLDGAKQFVGVMKTALSFTMMILEAINKLPTEIKAAGAGFLALNKLSGGLVGAGLGNILGGLGETVARSGGSRLPGIGKLFAQPVFVTNWPPGMGVGGAAGKGGGLGKALGGGAALGFAATVASAAAIVGALVITQKTLIEPQLQAAAGSNIGNTEVLIGRGDSAELTAAINGLRRMPDQLNPLQRVLYELNANGVKTHTEGLITAMEQALKTAGTGGMSPDERQAHKETVAKLATLDPKLDQIKITQERTTAKLGTITDRGSERQKSATEAMKERIAASQAETKRETSRGLGVVTSASRSNTGQIVGAIARNRPITNVLVNVSATTVKHTVEVTNRYGTDGGSRNNNNTWNGDKP